MEHIAGCMMTTPKEHILANKCQTWMGVITIADLASINEQAIPMKQWRATPIPGFAWPKQPGHSKAHWSAL